MAADTRPNVATDSVAPTCPACQQPPALCPCQPCTFCQQPLARCHQRVDERFPAAAREAYAHLGRPSIPTCAEGQRVDLSGISIQPGRARREGSGWNWDRARFHSEWRGAELTHQERYGIQSRVLP